MCYVCYVAKSSLPRILANLDFWARAGIMTIMEIGYISVVVNHMVLDPKIKIL